MKVEALFDFTIASITMDKSGEDRTPGLHLSDVIKSVMIDLDPATYANNSPMDMNRVEMGFTFEVMMEDAFERRHVSIQRIGEVERDGVIMSPDGLDAGDPPTLLETKFTWKSSRYTPWPCELHLASGIQGNCNMCGKEFGPKFYAWLLQMQGYCYALNINDAILRVLFVNNDYAPAGTPSLRAWKFHWSDEELAKQWAYMLRQAESKGLPVVRGKNR